MQPKITRLGFNRNLGYRKTLSLSDFQRLSDPLRMGPPVQQPRQDPTFKVTPYQRPQFDTQVYRPNPGSDNFLGPQAGDQQAGTDQPWDSYSQSDPILLRARAMAMRQRGESVAGAARKREELAVQFGLPELAQELGLGANVSQAARDNPLSVLATIRREGEKSKTGLEEELNDRRLHFGGFRGTKLGELAQAILGQETEARSGASSYLNDIEANLIAAQQQADMLELEAEAAAYARWLAGGYRGGPGPGGRSAPSGGGSQGVSPWYSSEWKTPGFKKPILGSFDWEW